MKKINILIVEDHKLLSETWRFLLNADDRFYVVGVCDNGRAAIEQAKLLNPHIIMMDINMPGINGLDATEIIKRSNPDVKVLGVSLHVQPVYAKKMMSKGAMGYITKNAPKEEMFHALLELQAGRKYLCTEIKDILSNEMGSEAENKNLDILSRREIEVVEQIKQGKSSKEIAETLNIAVKTIEVHRYNILKKLGIKNTAELVNFVNQNAI